MDTPIQILNTICLNNLTEAIYTLIKQSKTYTYRCEVFERCEEATGQSKKKAKHLSAKKMILRLFEENKFNLPNASDRQAIIDYLENYEKSLQESLNPPNPATKTEQSSVNSISHLQEICSKKHWQPPAYEEKPMEGKPHDPSFTCLCRIENLDLQSSGSGKTKKLAKLEAAKKMMTILVEEHLDSVDEIFDKISKAPNFGKSNERLDKLRNAIIEFQENRQNPDKNKNGDDQISLHKYFQKLRSNENLMQFFSETIPAIDEFVRRYMDDHQVLDNVQNLAEKIAKLINCRLDLIMHSYKSSLNQYQYWAELVSTEKAHQDLRVVSCGATGDNMEIARHKALTKMILTFVCLLKYYLKECYGDH